MLEDALAERGRLFQARVLRNGRGKDGHLGAVELVESPEEYSCLAYAAVIHRQADAGELQRRV